MLLSMLLIVFPGIIDNIYNNGGNIIIIVNGGGITCRRADLIITT